MLAQRQPHTPPEQQVVLQLLDQHPFRAHRVQHLQQQRPQHLLRSNRGTPYLRVQPLKLRRHLRQSNIGKLTNPPQRVLRRNPFPETPITEKLVLKYIVSAHTLFYQ
jgi:hypothetical protein